MLRCLRAEQHPPHSCKLELLEILQALDELLLLRVEVPWDFHLHVHIVVPSLALLSELRDAAATEAHPCFRLCALRDLDFGAPIDGLYLRHRAQHGVEDADRLVCVDVKTIALELLRRLDLHLNVQISGWSTTRALVALAADTELVSVVATRRNLHHDVLGLRFCSLTVAGSAQLLPDAVASGACLLRLHRADWRLDDLHDHASSTTRLALRVGPRILVYAAAGARRATLFTADLDVPRATEARDVEGERDLAPQIGPFCRTVVWSTSLSAAHAAHAAHAAEATNLSAERLAKNVAEDVLEVYAAHVRSATNSLDAGFAELVVALAFLRIRKDLVRLRDRLELLLRSRLFVHIGMPLTGQLPERGLDVPFAGTPTYAEDLVEVLSAAPGAPQDRRRSLAVATAPPP
mmetsp:Transcript_64855/g.180549  ORF Transcript_64855/g.180549 Transcript_64855/m.180549 type:complete len:406 (-) Transcript_64855:259-1476(-)